MDPGHLQDLLARIHNGDRQAAAELFHSAKPYLERIIRRRLERYAIPQALCSGSDCFQAVALAAWVHLALQGRSFLTFEMFLAWCRAVAEHKIDKAARHLCGPHLNPENRVPLEEVPPDAQLSREPASEQLALVNDMLDQMERTRPGARRALEMKMASWKDEDISDHLRINPKLLGRMFRWLRWHGFPLPE
jgi:DNA-directed RNA polymerase specialized sigma24 family protein